jgi:hypothetical protein
MTVNFVVLSNINLFCHSSVGQNPKSTALGFIGIERVALAPESLRDNKCLAAGLFQFLLVASILWFVVTSLQYLPVRSHCHILFYVCKLLLPPFYKDA